MKSSPTKPRSRDGRIGVTINDIAEKAGVAPATVSRALNGYSDIAESTRKRIVALTQTLNYQPSSRARQLARGRVETVAFVLPLANTRANDPFMVDFLDALAAALAARDYDLLLASIRPEEDEIDVYKRLIAAQKCSGFIITNSRDDDPRILLLSDLNIPFVVYGRATMSVPYAHIDMDNAEGIARLVDHLVALGHRRFAYLDLIEGATFARMRAEGFLRGVERNSLEDDAVRMVRVPHSSQGGQSAIGQLFDAGNSHRPTAIVCPADVVAIGAIQALATRGVRVGRDVSVTGYDGAPLAAYTVPPLTTMSQPTADVSQRLVDILFKVMDGAPPDTFSDILMPTLVRRSSDGSPTHVDGLPRKR
ncbi:MAG: LacI family DNA-binding transcriptional regulator [Pseudomonadota bacterium]